MNNYGVYDSNRSLKNEVLYLAFQGPKAAGLYLYDLSGIAYGVADIVSHRFFDLPFRAGITEFQGTMEAALPFGPYAGCP
jgi:hypothetical protein